MAITAFLTALSMMAPISACSGPPRAIFNVVATHGPVDVSADFTLARIAEMADWTKRIAKHPPLGFYIGDFGSTVSIEISVHGEADCSGPVRATVSLTLANRHIEIGKDLAAKPCVFSVVRDHYQRHAASDDAVLTEFAGTLAATLQRLSLPPLAHDPAFIEEDRRKMEQVVTSTIDRRLGSLDAARANARDAVDTAGETEKLTAKHCTGLALSAPLTSPPSTPPGSATSSPGRQS